jgi:hypothetical protein
MENHYEVAFYGEIEHGKDLDQVRKLMRPILGRSEADISHLFAGERVTLKKCPSYEYARKYADLFEKAGAKVIIEQIDAKKTDRPDNLYHDQTYKKQPELTKGFQKNPRLILTGVVLLIMGGGIGFWVASHYFAHHNLSAITHAALQRPAEQEQNLHLSDADAVHQAPPRDAQPHTVEGIQEEIARIESQIQETKAEDQKYSDGLIKALINSRLAVLKQTHAMLQQRAQASLFKVSLQYTVDSQAFSPPKDAAVQLGSVEHELEVLNAKVAAAETEAARYSGGLVQAFSLSTVAQLKQTQAMLEQKRLALKFSLPQYLSFKDEPASVLSRSRATLTDNSEDTTAQQYTQWRIVEVESRVTESNDIWWRYAWRLMLANDSQKPMVFDATIEFQDADGFVIDRDAESGLVVPPAAEKTFTGYALVRVPGAMKVQKTLAKVRVR